MEFTLIIDRIALIVFATGKVHLSTIKVLRFYVLQTAFRRS